MVKRYITGTILVGIVISLFSCSQEPGSFEDEMRQTFRDERGFFFIKVPPALLTLALRFTEDNEMTQFFGDARQVGIIAFGEGFPVSRNTELVGSLEDMMARWEYEDLMTISDSEKTIILKMKERDGKVSELVVIVAPSDGQVMAVTLSGNINLQTVVSMAADLDFEKLMQMQGMSRN